MIAAVLKLLRMRFRLVRNTFRHGSLGQKFGWIAGTGGALVFGITIGFFCWFVFRLMTGPLFAEALAEEGLADLLEQFLALIPVSLTASAFWLGILFTAGVLLQILYLSGDLEFLLSAPIPARAVFLAKMIQAVLPSLGLFLLFAAPVLISLGLSQGYSFLFFLSIPIYLSALVFAGAGISALVVMGVVRLVRPRRAAEILGVISGLVGMSFYLATQAGQSSLTRSLTPDQIAGLVQRTGFLTDPRNPLAWPGLSMHGLARGDWGPAAGFGFLTLAGSLLLLVVSLVAAEKLYFSGWARVQVGGGQRKRRKRPATPAGGRRSRGVLGWVPRPVTALVRKDIRLLRRDIRNLSQLVTPIVFAVVWMFFLFRGPRNAGSVLARSMEFSTLGVALYIIWLLSYRFGHGAFSMEGRQWWIIKSSPVRPAHLIVAKYLVTLAPVFITGLIFLLLADLVRSISLQVALFQVAAFTLVVISASALSLAFGIFGARFKWDNPAEIYRGGTNCLATLASGAFMATMGVIFIGLPLLGDFLNLTESIVLPAVLAIGAAVSIPAGFLPLALAGSRLSRLGEEEK